jgi:hypothetical protein
MVLGVIFQMYRVGEAEDISIAKQKAAAPISHSVPVPKRAVH